ncbi:MAG: prolyl oligopeptidase family serine peptidase, partial [bacterium]|nr:prolyl oligopeptidase family serine peptidase [bacterium]
MNPRRPHGGWTVVLASIPLLAGCAVGQRPGKGQVLYRVEAGQRGGYFLYLPAGYDEEARAGNAFPLVMTFHGMKPFDNAGSQIREWQQEADRYGYVVCAPLLSTSDLLSPLPLNRVTPSLSRDEARILAIMDELARTTSIDPGAVLSTCWSYGGYIAHYMINRHPERFSCLVAKQSNFSED